TMAVALALIFVISGCALFARKSESPNPETFSPMPNRIALCTVPVLDSQRVPRERVESLFCQRLGQLFETVSLLTPTLTDTGAIPRGDIVDAAQRKFLAYQDLSAEEVHALSARFGSDYLGIFTLTDFGQDWANLKKVTRVGVSFVVYEADQANEISRRSVLVEEPDSLSGRTYEAASERAVRLVLKQAADDLRKYYRVSGGFERVPDPRVHAAEQEKAPSNIAEWWQQRWRKIRESRER
ncbi:MAG TPA: hypothetical protein PKH07_10890, partial [bacterium]|nr:hypothetical protein [bacterium]